MKHIETAKQVISAPILGNPPSGQQPTGKLAPRDAAPLAEALVAYHSEYADVSKRREQRACAECYVHGQLSDLERKTVEPMVLALKGPDPSAVRAVQQLLGEGAWADAALLARRERLVAQDLGQADGVLICERRLCGLCQQPWLYVRGSALVYAGRLVQQPVAPRLHFRVSHVHICLYFAEQLPLNH